MFRTRVTAGIRVSFVSSSFHRQCACRARHVGVGAAGIDLVPALISELLIAYLLSLHDAPAAQGHLAARDPVLVGLAVQDGLHDFAVERLLLVEALDVMIGAIPDPIHVASFARNSRRI